VHTALGLLEVSSIARGYTVTDAMVKRAPVKVLESRPVTPGKYVILVSGDVAEVEEALKAGLATAGDALVDRLFLPQAHSQILPRVRGEEAPRVAVDALAVVETGSVASTLLSADAAAKAAEVFLLEMRLAVGIGGKGYFSMTGDLHQVEAALEAAKGAIGAWLVMTELIARPHDDFKGYLAANGRAP
jgi:microcompartment protein CcmL/EutN